jgi:hypothetical protein
MLASTEGGQSGERATVTRDALPLQSAYGNLKFSLPRGGRSSMVELQIVVLVVAGSSPVGHPINPR